MVHTQEWPIYFKNILRVGEIDSNVGVVTLWTERDVIQKRLDKKDYCVIGNLYAAAGINHMLRNIFANPNIRYLVMWGADMSQSGHALLKFMQNGIDDKYQIVGGRGEIEKEIGRSAVEDFRKHIEVIDLRGKPMAMVKETIAKLPKKEPFAKKPCLFPPAKPQISSLPSEEVGFRAEGDTVAQT
jgi:thymidylate synthase